MDYALLKSFFRLCLPHPFFQATSCTTWMAWSTISAWRTTATTSPTPASRVALGASSTTTRPPPSAMTMLCPTGRALSRTPCEDERYLVGSVFVICRVFGRAMGTSMRARPFFNSLWWWRRLGWNDLGRRRIAFSFVGHHNELSHLLSKHVSLFTFLFARLGRLG